MLGRLLADRHDAIFADGAATLFTNLRGRAIDWATQQRIPVIRLIALHAEAGALFSFGTSFGVRLRRSAQLVDKILKGAKPSDMPVEQATLFELVINLKTAKALGIKIPQTMLLRADRVIE